jgi:hypothetical protein
VASTQLALRRRKLALRHRVPHQWVALRHTAAGTVLAEYHGEDDDESAGEANEGVAEYQCPFIWSAGDARSRVPRWQLEKPWRCCGGR